MYQEWEWSEYFSRMDVIEKETERNCNKKKNYAQKEYVFFFFRKMKPSQTVWLLEGFVASCFLRNSKIPSTCVVRMYEI